MKLILRLALSIAPLAQAPSPSPAPAPNRDLTGPAPQNEPAPPSGGSSTKPQLLYKPPIVRSPAHAQPAEPTVDSSAAQDVKPYAGSLAEGLEELRALSEKN